MRFIRGISFLLMVFELMVLNAGCWNYREIDKLTLVTGAAIDKDDGTGKYVVTVEVLDIQPGGQDVETTTRTLSTEADTIFDAIRDLAKQTSERLFWSHAKTVIISRSIADEGILPIIDFISRDQETRFSMFIYISDKKMAKEVFQARDVPSENVSYFLAELKTIKNTIPEFPTATIKSFIVDIYEEGVEPIIPVVSSIENNGEHIPNIKGSVVFKDDKAIGYLNEEDTKNTLLIKDEINGGVFAQTIQSEKETKKMTLEIFKNDVKIIPRYINGEVMIEVKIDTNLSIGEMMGDIKVTTEKEHLALKESIEKQIESRCEKTIKKVQKEYGSDIFGFGRAIKAKMPKVWKQIGSEWDERFKDLKVSVKSNVQIRNTALMREPIENIKR